MPDPVTQFEGDEPEVDAKSELGEYCDSVRIIVTTNRGDGNWGTYSYGDGNYYAQRDSVRDWLMRQDQSTRDDA